ncbi:MAG TPA: GyrI-like domain-containing protein [Actinomycetota bacterium]
MGDEIEIKDLPDRYVATIRITTSRTGIGAAFDDLLPEVDAEIVNAGTRPAGPPFAIFHTYGDDEVDMEVGFPLDGPIPTSGRVIGRELAATLAAVTWHHGHYDSLGEAHGAVGAWLKQEGRAATGPPWEVYWSGPRDDPAPATWRTEVGYPIGD